MEENITSLVPSFVFYSKTYHFVVIDLEKSFIFVNEHFKQQFSLLTDDFIGLPFSLIIHQEDISKCDTALDTCISHLKKSVITQIRCQQERKEQNLYLMNWEFSVLENEQGKPIGISCLGYDLTEAEVHKSESQKALAFSESKLRAILDSANETNILISKEMKVMSFNKTAEENIAFAFGVKIKEGDDFKRYILREQEENFHTSFQKALQGQATNKETEIDLPNAKVWFQFRHFPVYSPQNEIIGVSFTVTNIDAQKRAEEKLIRMSDDLQSKNQLLSAILESPKSIIIFSLDNEYRYLSFTKTHKEVMKHIWGADIEIGKSMLDYITDNLDREKAKNNFDRVLRGEYFTEIEEYGSLLLYRTHWENRYSPMYSKENQTIIGLTVFVTDITDRVKNEAKISFQNERLKAIAWQQSHEVRRPVASILGLINLIRLEKSHEKAFELYFEHLYRATEELDTIIHRIVKNANEIE
jgi:PAS domain S-box-containing protein